MKKTWLYGFGLLGFLVLGVACGNDGAQESSSKVKLPDNHRYKVTFIELGSLNCVPCQMMQPVMKKVEKKYPDQVRVVFYDVWTEEQAYYAQYYRIRAIPTQVFLDENNVEYYRNEGYFPFDKLEKVLQMKGVQ